MLIVIARPRSGCSARLWDEEVRDVVSSTAGPRLNWGFLQAGGEAVTGWTQGDALAIRWDNRRRGGRAVPLDIARIWQLATESVGLVVQPIERFELAGTLNGHPGHLRSDEAKRAFPAIFALAVAARTADEPLRTHSQASATAALLAWATTYRPTGNPIDEWFFVPLLQAVDLVLDTLRLAQERALLGWVRAFLTRGDAFFAGRAPDNPAFSNNWTARRLLIRSIAASVCGDALAREDTAAMLVEFAARNYLADAAGRRDGRTVDFVQRDALHYHIAAVQPLVEAMLYTPDLAGDFVRPCVLSGLEFVRPYFLGELEHIEFLGTGNSFDRERRDDGNPVFQNAPWDPVRGRVILRLARAIFPEIRSWTEDIVDHHYDPRTKLLAAIYGEPHRLAEWAAEDPSSS
jgi:hypothetical protein